MNSTISVPTLEQAYVSYRALLFGALARFARQGFVVPPSDALDLIHDFFLEAWDKITAGYDPAKGRLEPYIYGAFVHFVRPRVVRLNRLQRELSDLTTMVQVEDERPSVDEELISRHDTAIVHQALEQLPSGEREVLLGYFGSEPSSERLLAQRFHVSRYKVREQLLKSLGTLVVLLNRRGGIAEADWKIAHAIWFEQRTIAETAGLLGLSETQIRRAHQRNLRTIGNVLNSYRHGHPTRRSAAMEAKSVKVAEDVRTLFTRALAAPGNRALLQQIRERANEIFEALESMDWEDSQDLNELDISWVAEVYGALSAEEKVLGPEDARLAQALFEARESDERSIGEAFEESLLTNLPPPLLDFDTYFESVPVIDEDRKNILLQSPAVKASLRSRKLVSRGITPMTVFAATEAVSMLIDRMVRHKELSFEEPIVLSRKERDTGLHRLTFNDAAKEIQFATRCAEKTSYSILSWTVEAAQFKPLMFRHLFAKPCGEVAVSLSRVSKPVESLRERWAHSQETARWAAPAAEASASWARMV